MVGCIYLCFLPLFYKLCKQCCFVDKYISQIKSIEGEKKRKTFTSDISGCVRCLVPHHSMWSHPPTPLLLICPPVHSGGFRHPTHRKVLHVKILPGDVTLQKGTVVFFLLFRWVGVLTCYPYLPLCPDNIEYSHVVFKYILIFQTDLCLFSTSQSFSECAAALPQGICGVALAV